MVAVTELRFEIMFHGPFRVGTGRAHDGSDAGLDLDDPLPSSHLKGLMRAAATALLPDETLVGQVFGVGHDRKGSPWAWDSAYPLHGTWAELPVGSRVRIAIDDTTGTAKPDHLQAGEYLWPPPDFRAAFTVTQVSPVVELGTHEAVLRLAARAVKAVGGQRRRGLGWVSLRTGAESAAAVRADLRVVGVA